MGQKAWKYNVRILIICYNSSLKILKIHLFKHLKFNLDNFENLYYFTTCFKIYII